MYCITELSEQITPASHGSRLGVATFVYISPFFQVIMHAIKQLMSLTIAVLLLNEKQQ